MGTALTLLDVILSIISVASYIISTYGAWGQVRHPTTGAQQPGWI
jgi:hypothetical protein